MKSVDHIYSYRTYSGSLESPPPVESLYKSILNKIKLLWGDRATHIIEPKLTIIPAHNLFDEKRLLPAWTHIAWVQGDEIDPEAHGSELVIVWFSNNSIVEIDDVINSVAWEAHAKDFQY